MGEEEGEVGWARVLGEGLFVLGFFREVYIYVYNVHQMDLSSCPYFHNRFIQIRLCDFLNRFTPFTEFMYASV